MKLRVVHALKGGRGVLMILSAVLLAANVAAEELADQAALCETCHLENGQNTDTGVPIVHGQEYYYLYLQLKDFKAGRRANPIMNGIVQDLDKEQMKALATYFAGHSWPRTGYRASDVIDGKAKAGLSAGQCVQCHLGGYEGSGAVPRLAGQHPTYLERTMLEFKDKTRQNAPDKSSLLRTYQEEDIAAMAEYLGGL
ncbi:MAG: c-type cytochrome [Gammaproteobacteria bacterium]|nr:c-type cytochrome [Gammaproteobacteria bacterium]